MSNDNNNDNDLKDYYNNYNFSFQKCLGVTAML